MPAGAVSLNFTFEIPDTELPEAVLVAAGETGRVSGQVDAGRLRGDSAGELAQGRSGDVDPHRGDTGQLGRGRTGRVT